MFCIRKACWCVWCVRNIMKISWDRLWAQCLGSGNFFDVCDTKHLLFVDNLCVYSSLCDRNESVDMSQFAYFCYALKVCTSLMIVKDIIFNNEMLPLIAIVCLHTRVLEWSIWLFLDSLHWENYGFLYANLFIIYSVSCYSKPSWFVCLFLFFARTLGSVQNWTPWISLNRQK